MKMNSWLEFLPICTFPKNQEIGNFWKFAIIIIKLFIVSTTIIYLTFWMILHNKGLYIYLFNSGAVSQIFTVFGFEGKLSAVFGFHADLLRFFGFETPL